MARSNERESRLGVIFNLRDGSWERDTGEAALAEERVKGVGVNKLIKTDA